MKYLFLEKKCVLSVEIGKIRNIHSVVMERVRVRSVTMRS